MRRLLIVLWIVLWMAPSQESRAQHASIPDAPVLYDTDLLSPNFHRDRRAAVRDALPENAVAILFSAPERPRENDVDFEYHQSSDLYYLTGTNEPASVLLLAPGGIDIDGQTVRELLMVPPRNPMSEVWTGRRFGAERAQAILGVQKAVTNERFEDILTTLATQKKVRFFHLPLPRDVDPDTDLGRQVALFRDIVHPLAVEGSGMVQWAVRTMMATNDRQTFARFQPIVKDRLNPQDLAGTPLQAAARAFVDATSFEEWQAWKQENFDDAYPDGIMLRSVLNKLRMIKTKEEMPLLQRAIDITAAAHREAMKSIEPGMYEYEAEALIEYVFRRNGSEYPGFPSIVGSGENAVVLHYESNRRQMQAEDMVVIDIGAEYHGYSADVTRTLPVNGVFSPEQKAIYEIVLKAQEAGIQAARAGNPFQGPHAAASQVISEGLQALGLIHSENEVRNFFMHGTSHYLGLYVHDVGTGEALAPGTIITVEPGIYVNPSPNVDPKWWNIGVRIEDDILITDGDPVVLSAGAPRSVEEIEALMREKGLGNEPAGLVEQPVTGPAGTIQGSQ